MSKVTAKHGEKMIQLTVRFWTDNIADEAGMLEQKVAWDSGMVRVETNETHGITSQQTLPFHSMLDLPRAIEEALIQTGIKLKHNQRSLKYMIVGRDGDTVGEVGPQAMAS